MELPGVIGEKEIWIAQVGNSDWEDKQKGFAVARAQNAHDLSEIYQILDKFKTDGYGWDPGIGDYQVFKIPDFWWQSLVEKAKEADGG